jgi:glyoxylase-like metal-dependent hydrolase (beta-lactamase superfamily II)
MLSYGLETGMKRSGVMAALVLALLALPHICLAANYEMKKVADGIFAAIALPGGKAASNALVIVAEDQVILAGAHFVAETMKELTAEVAKISSLPIRYVILTHHHKGYNHIDFDFPPGAEIITSWQTWQSLKSEFREFKYNVTFFDRGMTLQRGKRSITLNNTELAHSEGDVVLYIPSENLLFTSDLVYNGTIGYMGEGYMRDWVINLEVLEGLGARIVVPGLGPVTDSSGIKKFRLFFKDFLTEVLRHVEKGESLTLTKKRFSLPQHESLPGYKTFIDANITRAYENLKEK